MTVRMIPTPESGQIERFGYDRQTQTLVVEFKGGSMYGYDRVPLEIFIEMYDSSSVGKYFNASVKGTYSYQKLYPTPTPAPGTEVKAR